MTFSRSVQKRIEAQTGEKLFTQAEVDALVAAAYEDAACVLDNEIIQRKEFDDHMEPLDALAKKIRSSTPADAQKAIAEHDAALRARQLELQDEIDVFVRKQAELREQLTHLQTGCAEWKGKAKKLESENAGLRLAVQNFAHQLHPYLCKQLLALVAEAAGPVS